MNSAFNGHNQVIEILVRAGADINARDNEGYTALAKAAKNGHLQAVQTLINLRADPNIPTAEGKTALQFAVENGHRDVANFLRSRGAR
jgi:ankyrin repeat protein